jgi:uncharacterized protein (DUF2336 family)
MFDYDKAKRLAAEPDAVARRRLAERPDVQPEILYYLAEDKAPEVRLAVAGNLRTPRQADAILARDRELSVRERLAHKIARLAPGLSEREQAHLRDLTYEVIAILAVDRTSRIRAIIAEAVKNLADAPPEIVSRLARDVEIEVAGPILESSPLLNDDELIGIIRSQPIQGALAAIARRRRLGSKLSDCLVAAAIHAPDRVIAVTTLLRNHEAEIDAATMEKLVELAPGHVEWHEPIVTRPILPLATLRRLAGFISHALFDALRRHGTSDPEAAREIAQAVKWRLAAEGQEEGAIVAAEIATPSQAALPVGEAAVAKALSAGQLAAVAGALARDTGYPEAVVRKVLSGGDPKAILALAWKAGYSAPLALSLQVDAGAIPAAAALKPADDGKHYPLSDAELEWQLDLIQVPSTRLSREIDRLGSASR